MQVNVRRRVAILLTVVVATVGMAAPVAAADPTEIVVESGVTQPVFGYANAIRERVFVTTDFDSEGDGSNDVVAMDIIRPVATENGLKAPVIMDASPYYTTVCRGHEGECINDVDGDGINDRWPLFYDNYFVPRGYAIVLLHMAGTGFSTGCPTTGGTPDNLSAVAAIDWLNGRRAGRDAAGNPVVADWHNGKTGMIGKSYDGTLANAAAALGTEGLATIVPISAISNWYYYTRLAGSRLNGWHSNYPASLSNTVTNPARRAYCSPFRSSLNVADGDENGDFTPFWFERDYLHLLDDVNIPVFVSHGLQDDNVKTNHFADWWYGLQERDVPRKLWLTRTGHEDPFDYRRTEWVATLHRWFDRWLQGVNNDVLKEPTVDIEDLDGGDFETHAKWPLHGTVPTRLWFRPGSDTEAGGFGLSRLQGKPQTTTFQDRTNQSETQMIANLTTVLPNRLVYISEPLEAPIRISGTPLIELSASGDQADTDFGAALVDFGPNTLHVSRSSEGVVTAQPPVENCWGESASVEDGDAFTDDGCYFQTATVQTTASTWRVARGSVDGFNLYDHTSPTPLVPGQVYDFAFELYPTDYVFGVGHQIAIVVVSTYPTLTCSFNPALPTSSANTCAASNTNRPNVTLTINNSRVALPIVGGQGAAQAAGF